MGRMGPRASADRRVELDLGEEEEEEGEGTENPLIFDKSGPQQAPKRPTPQDPLRSALRRGPIVPS